MRLAEKWAKPIRATTEFAGKGDHPGMLPLPQSAYHGVMIAGAHPLKVIVADARAAADQGDLLPAAAGFAEAHRQSGRVAFARRAAQLFALAGERRRAECLLQQLRAADPSDESLLRALVSIETEGQSWAEAVTDLPARTEDPVTAARLVVARIRLGLGAFDGLLDTALREDQPSAQRRILCSLLAEQVAKNYDRRAGLDLLDRAPAPNMTELRLQLRIQSGELGQALLDDLAAAVAAGHDSLRERYLDLLWRRDGAASALVTALGWRDATPTILETVIALEVELGEVESARTRLRAAPELTKRATAVLPIAHLLVDEPELDPDGAKAAMAHARLFEQLAAGSTALAARMADPARSLAVVGNSACEIGQGRGPEIDGHDEIIRFNRFTLEGAYARDYGARTTAHFRVPDSKLGARPLPADVAVMFGPHNARFRGRIWAAALTAVGAGRVVAGQAHDPVARLIRRLDSSPSSGLGVLAWIREVRGAHPTSVFGFSLVDQIGADPASSHYFEATAASCRHDWEKEAALLAQFRAGAPL